MYEDLEIEPLLVGQHVAGLYRGGLFHTIPIQPDREPESGMGRVFLETDAGPRAIGGNGYLQDQLAALKPEDGDRIIVHRASEDIYRVIKEVPDSA